MVLSMEVPPEIRWSGPRASPEGRLAERLIWDEDGLIGQVAEFEGPLARFAGKLESLRPLTAADGAPACEMAPELEWVREANASGARAWRSFDRAFARVQGRSSNDGRRPREIGPDSFRHWVRQLQREGTGTVLAKAVELATARVRSVDPKGRRPRRALRAAVCLAVLSPSIYDWLAAPFGQAGVIRSLHRPSGYTRHDIMRFSGSKWYSSVDKTIELLKVAGLLRERPGPTKKRGRRLLPTFSRTLSLSMRDNMSWDFSALSSLSAAARAGQDGRARRNLSKSPGWPPAYLVGPRLPPRWVTELYWSTWEIHRTLFEAALDMVLGRIYSPGEEPQPIPVGSPVGLMGWMGSDRHMQAALQAFAKYAQEAVGADDVPPHLRQSVSEYRAWLRSLSEWQASQSGRAKPVALFASADPSEYWSSRTVKAVIRRHRTASAKQSLSGFPDTHA